MERVLDALTGAGVAKRDLRTEQVALSPRTSDDGITIVGYVAANTVRATIGDFAARGGGEPGLRPEPHRLRRGGSAPRGRRGRLR
jgi:hypothetical protein